ncbi:MAG: UDP-N-acetylglucosamine--N-acetylmuramyl-(pentapeptide) pyrophosphoryl-undecaprenol N-acetylglucosamine transferase [Anaerolineae bacterium]|nr:UDP-N-acetylglucosamine--N-acetylmuramyl-(pentapeptide) pyrophosphoryl-undecaprenol N-acetylglucosamine transferase [Anaerolineae bacterium]
MRMIIAAGGTGGHVYPALAVVEAIQANHPDTPLIFIGTVGGFERPLIEKAGIAFSAHYEVSAGPIHGVNPLKAISSAFKLMRGTWQSFRILGREKPNVILSTGGWEGLPVALAARLRGVPLMIYLPDIEPGLTIKVLRLFAQKVAITVDESQKFFREGQTIITGYPLRQQMTSATREAGIAHFGLNPTKKTLLIFGGSRGARAINIGIGDILGDILNDGVQVIHLTGTLDYDRFQGQIGDLKNHPDYHAFAYLHDDMGLAMACADLCVCRAGASVLGEFPFFRLPSILIPLAYSWRYQQINADYLASRGGAIHLDETRMDAELLPTIRALLGDSARLEAMREAVGRAASSDGASNLAQALIGLAQAHAQR